MKLLADENIPVKTIQELRKNGYDIKFIGEENPAISDREVIHISDNEGRTIFTFDRDFGELIYRHNLKPKAGVIYLRISKFGPEYPAKLLLKIFKLDNIDFRGSLTIIDDKKIRQRKY